MTREDEEHGLARATDPGTSWAAAREIDTLALQDLILMKLSKTPEGQTILQMAETTGIAYQTISPRFAQLRKKRKIYDTGLRVKNTTGRKAIVWRLQSLLEEEIDRLLA